MSQAFRKQAFPPTAGYAHVFARKRSPGHAPIVAALCWRPQRHVTVHITLTFSVGWKSIMQITLSTHLSTPQLEAVRFAEVAQGRSPAGL